MELIRAIAIDSVPSLLDLFRFGLISALQLIRTVLLSYPLNIAIFVTIIFAIFYSIVKKILPKPKFSATYAPLRHQENSAEEIKILKKQIREVQSELIDMLKTARKSREVDNNQQKPENLINEDQQKGQEVDEQLQSFIRQSQSKSLILDEVQEELRRTVVVAYEEVVKMRAQ